MANGQRVPEREAAACVQPGEIGILPSGGAESVLCSAPSRGALLVSGVLDGASTNIVRVRVPEFGRTSSVTEMKECSMETTRCACKRE